MFSYAPWWKWKGEDGLLLDRLSSVHTEKIWYKGFIAVLDTYIYDKLLAPMTPNDTHQRVCGSVTQNNPIFYVRRLLCYYPEAFLYQNMQKISRINTRNTSINVWIFPLMQEVQEIYMQTC